MEENSEVLVIPEAQATSGAEVVEEAVPPMTRKQRVLSTTAALKVISGAVAGGEISRRQAKQLRTRMGVTSAYFTKSVSDKDKKKAKRKTAEASRKRNRGLGKGQKRSSGKLGKYT